MIRLSRRHLLHTGFALAVSGCAAPPAQYYRLAAVPGAARSIRAQTIRIRNIGIPAYLEQNNIARPSGQYGFAVYPNDLWAEPLAGMLQTVLVEDLAQRLPAATVTAGNGAIGTPADLFLEIDLLRFDPDASGTIVLSGQAALRQAASDTFLATQNLQFSAAPAAADAAATAACMSALWGQWADAVAALV